MAKNPFNKKKRRYKKNKVQNRVEKPAFYSLEGIDENALVESEFSFERPYLSNQNWTINPSLQVVGRYADCDIEKIGNETLRKMSKDDEVASSLMIYLNSIFTNDIIFASPIIDKDDPDYELGQEIAKQANREKLCADFVWEDELRSATKDFLIYGTSAVEHSIEFKPNTNKWEITELLAWGNNDFHQVVDTYERLVGLLPVRYGYFQWAGHLNILPTNEKTETDNIIPKEKFSTFNYNRNGRGLKGEGIIAPAFPSWFNKQLLLLELSKYIKRFVPVVTGVIGENASGFIDPKTGEQKTAVEGLIGALQRLENGGVGAFSYGTELEVLDLAKSGDFFLSLLRVLNLQVARAITQQHLASGEGEHQARSSSEVHQDILHLGIKDKKTFLSRFLRVGTMRSWAILNYGLKNTHLTPLVLFGHGSGVPLSNRDIIELLIKGRQTPEQVSFLNSALGLPQATIDEIITNIDANQSNLNADPNVPDSLKDATNKVVENIKQTEEGQIQTQEQL